MSEVTGTRGDWPWRQWTIVRCLLGVIVLLVMVPGASAQVPERQRQFVYGFYSFKGDAYATGFVPPSVDAVYILADHDNVLDPKWTEVYFWPLTNEYRADFAALNELVPGTLELMRGGQAVTTLPLTEYVVQVDQAKPIGGESLAVGEAARQRHAAFEQERAASIERMTTYARAHQEYLSRVQAGDRQATPPVEPAPFTLFSTGLNRGFVLRLPAGEYQIRLLDQAGAVVPGSDKRLLAITPRRQGIGYEVVPQEKWTLPERSSDPSHAIYTLPGGVIYLRPFIALEFNALEYARLERPQDLHATPNRWTWVHIAPIETATLVVEGVGAPQRLALTPFAVEQVPGPALGYTIRPFEPGPEQPGRAPRSPDLRAYQVTAPAERGTMRFSLVDEAGRPLEGSAREFVAAPSVPDWFLALPVLLPLLAGLTVLLWRRRQVVTARSLRPEQRRLMA